VSVHVQHRLSNATYVGLTFCSDFGGIFAELLPGNFAKLQPPVGQDLMDGLEVKVQLGTVWKQSLTELSGGQRYVEFLDFVYEKETSGSMAFLLQI